jgi:hypothetical protein
VSEELILTREEAAHRAGVPASTIQLWMRAGLLHPIGPARLGHRNRPILRATELDCMLEQRSQHLRLWSEVWA